MAFLKFGTICNPCCDDDPDKCDEYIFDISTVVGSRYNANSGYSLVRDNPLMLFNIYLSGVSGQVLYSDYASNSTNYNGGDYSKRTTVWQSSSVVLSGLDVGQKLVFEAVGIGCSRTVEYTTRSRPCGPNIRIPFPLYKDGVDSYALRWHWRYTYFSGNTTHVKNGEIYPIILNKVPNQKIYRSDCSTYTFPDEVSYENQNAIFGLAMDEAAWTAGYLTFSKSFNYLPNTCDSNMMTLAYSAQNIGGDFRDVHYINCDPFYVVFGDSLMVLEENSTTPGNYYEIEQI